jgi:NADP-dependent 3-hydroxy acid dehydrogenase YdfG
VKIQGKTALVTGATGGIGKAIARALVAEGARVIVSGRRSEVLDELVASLGGEHHAHKLVADLADADSARRAIATAGQVDILVVNHALPASGRLDDYDADSVQRQLDVNLTAPIALAHAVVPSMIERGEGHVVFISSIAGKVASGGGSLYAAT